MFEGAQFIFPNNIHEVLIDEYHDYEKPEYSPYMFSHNLRMWVDSKTCENFTNNEFKYATETRSPKLTLLTCDDKDILELYHTTKELTQRRFKELEYIKNNSEHEIYDSLPVIDLISKGLFKESRLHLSSRIPPYIQILVTFLLYLERSMVDQLLPPTHEL